jgi:hypothetical protein
MAAARFVSSARLTRILPSSCTGTAQPSANHQVSRGPSSQKQSTWRDGLHQELPPLPRCLHL